MRDTEFDVAIVGFGPVGATLAHLLGLRGVRTLVLEREDAAYHLPRAVHFDDEIMRVFQWIGIADEMVPKMRINAGMQFFDPQGRMLLDWPRPQVESPLGWHPSWRMHQPDLEAVLRVRLTARPTVTVRNGCDVTQVDDQGGHVELTYDDRTIGETRHVRAAYVVGCDGGRSLVRRVIGTGMQDFGFNERWLVVDVLLKRDKPELGDVTVQYCNPQRPQTYVRGPGMRRRWEITVLPDETDEEVTAEPEVWKRLSRWLTPDEAEIERATVYTFHSLIAEQWRRGRLFIAGDAAHQTPPFMGQGMCAGIRDGANLAWKLNEVIVGRADPALLDTYQSERAPNTEEFIRGAVRLGGLINAADSESALRAAIPQADGSTAMKSIYPPLGPGLGQGPNAGRQFGQPRLPDGRRMDDLAPYAPVIVADAGLADGFIPPDGTLLVTTDQIPEAAEHLAAFDTRAVLLRPDRYILGCADNAAELAGLAALLPGASVQSSNPETV